MQKSNNPLSKRAEKALAVLEAGGKFREMLERNGYTGREQFRHRLIDANGAVIRGIGFATLEELRGMLRPLTGGTTVSSYYGLRTRSDIAEPRHF